VLIQWKTGLALAAAFGLICGVASWAGQCSGSKVCSDLETIECTLDAPIGGWCEIDDYDTGLVCFSL